MPHKLSALQWPQTLPATQANGWRLWWPIPVPWPKTRPNWWWWSMKPCPTSWTPKLLLNPMRHWCIPPTAAMSFFIASLYGAKWMRPLNNASIASATACVGRETPPSPLKRLLWLATGATPQGFWMFGRPFKCPSFLISWPKPCACQAMLFGCTLMWMWVAVMGSSAA